MNATATTASALLDAAFHEIDEARAETERLIQPTPWGRPWAVSRRNVLIGLVAEIRTLRADPPGNLEELVVALEGIRSRIPSRTAPPRWDPPAWAAERLWILDKLATAAPPQRPELLALFRQRVHPELQRARLALEDRRRDAERTVRRGRSAETALAARSMGAIDAALARLEAAELENSGDPIVIAAECLALASGGPR